MTWDLTILLLYILYVWLRILCNCFFSVAYAGQVVIPFETLVCHYVREQEQYKNPSNNIGWRRPPVEEVELLPPMF